MINHLYILRSTTIYRFVILNFTLPEFFLINEGLAFILGSDRLISHPNGFPFSWKGREAHGFNILFTYWLFEHEIRQLSPSQILWSSVLMDSPTDKSSGPVGGLTAHEDARNISDGATSGLSRKERKAKGLQKNQALAHYAVFIPLFLDWLISLRNPLRGKNSKFFASVLSASLSNMKSSLLNKECHLLIFHWPLGAKNIARPEDYPY